MFLGVLEIPDIFWGWTVDAGPETTYEEKINVPTPHPPLPPPPPPVGPSIHWFILHHELFKYPKYPTVTAPIFFS